MGTTASVRAYTEHSGWDSRAFLLVLAGVSITGALWWFYFSLDVVASIKSSRPRAFAWGYLHIFVFATLAATGAADPARIAIAGGSAGGHGGERPGHATSPGSSSSA